MVSTGGKGTVIAVWPQSACEYASQYTRNYFRTSCFQAMTATVVTVNRENQEKVHKNHKNKMATVQKEKTYKI